jgi:hypothetical protein
MLATRLRGGFRGGQQMQDDTSLKLRVEGTCGFIGGIPFLDSL